ncbi:hypothetical protein AURDEDRAFT_121593 [Auricularia subglabra TFB-10046 SS5]|nr:hypothetical protein AURDEDRAFT_121593 [Auricularia subglabra TFB-10046 SS5]
MSSQPSCTILVTSSSITLARSLVARIVQHATGAPSAHDGDPDNVAWTIDNKYYTAPVHFNVHTTNTLDAAEPGPPALVYVFAKGKPFRDEFAKLQPALAEHDFEVTLAAAVRADGASGAHADEDDADAFFREHGFEFVDADATHGAADADPEDGAVGVPRIVDALSTILWPSMSRKGTQRASRLGPSIVVGSGDEDALLSFLAGAGGPLHGAARGDEMAALERWLEEDDGNSTEGEHHEIASPVSAGADGGLVPPHGAWTHFPSGSSTSLASPIAPRPPIPEPSASSFVPPVSSSSSTPHAGSPTGAGFEDDFADFVTAPASESSFDTAEPDADAGYNALLDSDDDDADLPSHDEIRSASERIFGPDGPADERDPDFDISHAFSALQAMREEIGAISDDTERRRAAARVALGFAYGLDLGNEGPERNAKN